MVLNNTVLYMVLGASLAGIFEEIGRWVAFRYFLKAKTKKETAISYGIGHGGAEIILLIGVPFLVMLLMPELREQVGSISYGWVMLERISAMLFHLGMSILVFCGVHQKGKGWYVLLAIFLHAGFDLFAAAYQVGVLTNVPLVEGILCVISMVVFWTMYGLLYRKNTSQEMEC